MEIPDNHNANTLMSNEPQQEETLDFVDPPLPIDAFEIGRQQIEQSAAGNLPVTIAPREKNAGTDDYEYVKNNLKELTETGMGAVQALAVLARQSESARVFEVLATLIKATSEVNHDILKVDEVKQKNTGASGQQGTVNQTAIFVGTNADVNKMLSQHGIITHVEPVEVEEIEVQGIRSNDNT